MAKAASTVIEAGFREALRRDPNRERRWVVLLDGNDEQLQAVKRAARRVRVQVTIVVDLIHLVEYLWSTAYCFHPAGSDAARDWVVQRIRAFLSGSDPAQIAAGIRRSATLRGLERRAAVDECAQYILKLAPYMRYGEALAGGLPISKALAAILSGDDSALAARDGPPQAPKPFSSSRDRPLRRLRCLLAASRERGVPAHPRGKIPRTDRFDRAVPASPISSEIAGYLYRHERAAPIPD